MSERRTGTVAFDVIGTLFSLDRVREALRDEGAAGALEVWFPAVLRDYFALSHSGSYAPMKEVLAVDLERTTDLDEAARERVMAGFGALDPAPGATEACEVLADAGWRLLTLTNSSEEATTSLLERAGIRHRFHAVLSCDTIEVSKPHRDVYALAQRAGAGEVWLVASHAWDIGGAAAAGLRTAWVDEAGAVWPSYLGPPDVQATDLVAAAWAILAHG